MILAHGKKLEQPVAAKLLKDDALVDVLVLDVTFYDLDITHTVRLPNGDEMQVQRAMLSFGD